VFAVFDEHTQDSGNISYVVLAGSFRRHLDHQSSPKLLNPDPTARNHRRLLTQALIGRFKPINDFDGDWPKKFDREL
jgi:hypothetical protein